LIAGAALPSWKTMYGAPGPLLGLSFVSRVLRAGAARPHRERGWSQR
jgi:hypothetical protein